MEYKLDNNNKELLNSLVLELRRGTIILCVLSQLKEPQYGYSLITLLEEKKISIDAGTLYPLLRRLEKQNLLVSNWDVNSTKPRKYYELSDLGRAIYKELSEQWLEMSKTMDELLKE